MALSASRFSRVRWLRRPRSTASGSGAVGWLAQARSQCRAGAVASEFTGRGGRLGVAEDGDESADDDLAQGAAAGLGGLAVDPWLCIGKLEFAGVGDGAAGAVEDAQDLAVLDVLQDAPVASDELLVALLAISGVVEDLVLPLIEVAVLVPQEGGAEDEDVGGSCGWR